MDLRSPTTPEEFQAYYDLRWRILRAPWGQPRGSERDEGDHHSQHFMICDDNGMPLAVARLQWNSPQETQVRYMAVEENCRGNGYGTRLLCHLERVAEEKGAERMVLNARSEAVPFYQRHGYKVVAPGKRLFDQIDHIQMQKFLAKGI